MSARCACSTASKLSSSLATVARPSLTFTRTFTSNRRETIPPESPRYVQVPEPKQGQRAEIVPPRIPGSLPPPRPIFTKKREHKLRQHMEKPAKPYKEPVVRTAPPVDSPRDIKRRMAETRRRNLIEGLSGLLDRKEAHDAHLKEKSDRHTREVLRMRNAPERADDVLTRPTVLNSTLDVAVKPDPKRFANAESSKKRTTRWYNQKAQKRHDALMALYATATDFIVDEEQLSREVDKIFQEDFFKKQAHSLSPDGDNAWDVWGPPSTLGFLASAGARAGNAQEWDHTESDRAVRRQKSIAEDLTGGNLGSATKQD